MVRKLDEIRSDLNSQILATMNSAITDQVFSIQITLGEKGRGNNTLVDYRSSGLHSNPEAKNVKKTQKTASKQVSNLVDEITPIWRGQ